MAPVTRIRTYHNTSRIQKGSKSKDAFNALFARNITKRLQICSKKYEKSSIAKSINENDASVQSSENTFDRLLKGNNFNQVQLKNGPIFNNTTNSDLSESKCSFTKISISYDSPIITRNRRKHKLAFLEISDKFTNVTELLLKRGKNTLEKSLNESLAIEVENKIASFSHNHSRMKKMGENEVYHENFKSPRVPSKTVEKPAFISSTPLPCISGPRSSTIEPLHIMDRTMPSPINVKTEKKTNLLIKSYEVIENWDHKLPPPDAFTPRKKNGPIAHKIFKKRSKMKKKIDNDKKVIKHERDEKLYLNPRVYLECLPSLEVETSSTDRIKTSKNCENEDCMLKEHSCQVHLEKYISRECYVKLHNIISPIDTKSSRLYNLRSRTNDVGFSSSSIHSDKETSMNLNKIDSTREAVVWLTRCDDCGVDELQHKFTSNNDIENTEHSNIFKLKPSNTSDYVCDTGIMEENEPIYRNLDPKLPIEQSVCCSPLSSKLQVTNKSSPINLITTEFYSTNSSGTSIQSNISQNKLTNHNSTPKCNTSFYSKHSKLEPESRDMDFNDESNLSRKSQNVEMCNNSKTSSQSVLSKNCSSYFNISKDDEINMDKLSFDKINKITSPELRNYHCNHICSTECKQFILNPKVMLTRMEDLMLYITQESSKSIIDLTETSTENSHHLPEYSPYSIHQNVDKSSDIIDLSSDLSLDVNTNNLIRKIAKSSLNHKCKKDIVNLNSINSSLIGAVFPDSQESTKKIAIYPNHTHEETENNEPIRNNHHYEIDSSHVTVPPISIHSIGSSNLTVPLSSSRPVNESKTNLSHLPDIIETSTLENNDDKFLFPNYNIGHKRTNKQTTLLPGKFFRRSLSLLRRSTIGFRKLSNGSSVNDTIYEDTYGLSNRRMSIRMVPVSLQKSRSQCTPLETYAELSTSYVVSGHHRISEHLESNLRKLSIRAENLSLEEPITTAKDIVLRRCGQTEPLPFEKCYPPSLLKNCHKIGEGVYGEVFLFRNQNGGTTVMKVIPIEGDLIVNEERQKKYEEIISEIIISMELSNLRKTKRNYTTGFSEVKNIRCVKGCYPQRMLELWELYDETRNSENDSPEIFTEDQLYIVLELSNGGQDVEAYQFNNSVQTVALFKQTVCALAVAENQLQFEHRDLHWGNVLVNSVDKEKDSIFVIDGKEITVPTNGIEVAIIDFTLSRIEFERVVIYNDLGLDNELFSAKGDYQFEIYRLMQKKNDNEWQHFEPYTNILWLHYLLDKLLKDVHYKNPHSKLHKEHLHRLKKYKEDILEYGSVNEFVISNFLD